MHQGAGGARLAGAGTAGPAEPLRPGDPAPPAGSAPYGVRPWPVPSPRHWELAHCWAPVRGWKLQLWVF